MRAECVKPAKFRATNDIFSNRDGDDQFCPRAIAIIGCFLHLVIKWPADDRRAAGLDVVVSTTDPDSTLQDAHHILSPASAGALVHGPPGS